jgi:glycosyltransferase involved in cell wall biosynthesis
MRPPLLWIASHLFSPSGIADEARGFLRALEGAGWEPAARELSPGKAAVPLPRPERAMLQRQLGRDPASPPLAVHHYVPRPGRYVRPSPLANVARVLAEVDGLPRGWRELLADRDRVWVPSRHNLELFIRGGVPAQRVRILPGTLDFGAFRPGLEPYPLSVPPGHLVFLTNFDFSERKGWRELLLAWARAFEPGDPVCLVLKTGSVVDFTPAEVTARIDGFLRRRFGHGARRRLAPVRLIARMLPAREVPRLYAAADAYVSVSRGEAWGRPYMEALAMGLPTIGSRWGGNLDFMDESTSWLVDGELVPVPPDAEVLPAAGFYRGHRWFQADVDELAAALRDVAADPSRARRRAAPARAQLEARFGPSATCARVEELARDALAPQGRLAEVAG